MSKLIFFDIDGTLWDEKMQIPESTKRTIAELKKNGHKTFLCSGRARGNIRSRELFDLGFDGVLAACGNHIEMDGKILYEKLLDGPLVERVIRVLEECHMPVVLEGPTHHWISETGFENDPFVLYIFREMGESAIPLKGYNEEIRINKFSADILPDSDYARVKREIGDKLDFLEHEGDVVEFIPKGTSKATGIAWLCDYLHVDRADTYAVGDSVNDLDMLRFVGHGIAMGNATAPTKEAAEYVTSDIHDDGIYRAMQHYGLVEDL
jgi:hypothetical protein